jgi:hypothetical protein
MACKCEILNVGKIKGVRVCKECVDAGKALSTPLKLMMADVLRTEVKEIREKAEALNQIFKQEIVN